jgi:hypothetical protein
MSTVGASNNNPYAYIQAQWQRGKTQSSAAQGSTSQQGDAPSQTFTATSTQGTSAPASTPAAPASTTTSGSGGGTFPRYEPQTLQTLLALQSTGG